MKKIAWLGALLALGALAAAGADAPLTVTVAPERVWIVENDGVRKVNFDFLVRNAGPAAAEIVELRLAVFDRRGDFVLRRELNRQGMIASIRSLLTTAIGAGQTVQLLNPFSEFPASVDPGLLDYTLVFEPKAAEGAAEPAPVPVRVQVKPQAFRPRTRLALPLKGKVYVIDGHDFMAHHRRIDLTHPLIVQLGMKYNISRYGMDFVVVDAAGNHFKSDGSPTRGDPLGDAAPGGAGSPTRGNPLGDAAPGGAGSPTRGDPLGDAAPGGAGGKVEDYYVFGRPVLAPAAAIVADCIEGRPDNKVGEMAMDYDELLRTRDLRLFGGNFVVLDHGNGEFTFFAHLKQGSLRVKKGDRVAAGQEIGRVGNSGDSFWPHLHFQVMTSANFDCELLPAVFSRYTLYRGQRAIPVASGMPDTGDLIEGR